jgi:hypothetical protein
MCSWIGEGQQSEADKEGWAARCLSRHPHFPPTSGASNDNRRSSPTPYVLVVARSRTAVPPARACLVSSKTSGWEQIHFGTITWLSGIEPRDSGSLIIKKRSIFVAECGLFASLVFVGAAQRSPHKSS